MIDPILYVYAVTPMDWGWKLLPTVPAFMQRMVEEYGPESVVGEMATFMGFLRRAEAAAQVVGWEGDFRHGFEPHVAVMPAKGGTTLALVWKQDNNGATFVVSQVALPWLGAPDLTR